MGKAREKEPKNGLGCLCSIPRTLPFLSLRFLHVRAAPTFLVVAVPGAAAGLGLGAPWIRRSASSVGVRDADGDARCAKARPDEDPVAPICPGCQWKPNGSNGERRLGGDDFWRHLKLAQPNSAKPRLL
jgi:hypothetical protein